MGSKRAESYHIEIDRRTCLQCAGCVSICPTRALDMHGLDLRCEDPLCIGCDLCVRFCPVVSLVLEARPAPDASAMFLRRRPSRAEAADPLGT